MARGDTRKMIRYKIYSFILILLIASIFGFAILGIANQSAPIFLIGGIFVVIRALFILFLRCPRCGKRLLISNKPIGFLQRRDFMIVPNKCDHCGLKLGADFKKTNN